ncbi:MAG: ABC transporter ATP-binding protein [Candidatus Binatus sp.]|uniref:ABC transporter ATP-binding protein n=1 Tax=Candidatus Binatus sp. TaxID=2811406 RepID=UPI002726D10C|nr:ABC transporter ATP-binding protein [Candidatus Binatus sp.]MDO8431594.1 ABC transporter ATP-binding protein [Candidatus Binatus sp.]
MPARYAKALRGGFAERRNSREPTTIWALRDLDLDIGEGEVLGVIGRNGAGKSTLLKILSRITEPTTGRAELYGRVGSLLEVGTGFHPELTGRDNIYLSGAILGMRRNEIERKFDEIVAFAEIDKFVDTTVKHYSSGMYVRLAFAVAAHLEPEILLVDEVLAVGDAEFQKKCLGKMGDVARQGRTVVFISHNMASIEGLCTSCLMLAGGRSTGKGKPQDVIGQYLKTELRSDAGHRSLRIHPGRRAGSIPIMDWVELQSGPERQIGAVRMDSELTVHVGFTYQSRPLHPVLGVTVRTLQGAAVFNVNNKFIAGFDFDRCMSGTISCTLDNLPLMPGTYSLDLWFGDRASDLDVIFEAISFDVIPADVFGTAQLPWAHLGPVFCRARFGLEPGSPN